MQYSKLTFCTAITLVKIKLVQLFFVHSGASLAKNERIDVKTKEARADLDRCPAIFENVFS